MMVNELVGSTTLGGSSDVSLFVLMSIGLGKEVDPSSGRRVCVGSAEEEREGVRVSILLEGGRGIADAVLVCLTAAVPYGVRSISSTEGWVNPIILKIIATI